MQHCDVSVDNSNCLPKSARGLLAQPVLISVIHSDSLGSNKKQGFAHGGRFPNISSH